MRITITSGTGSGQTAYIGDYTSQLKLPRFKEDGTTGFDVFVQQVLQLLQRNNKL